MREDRLFAYAEKLILNTIGIFLKYKCENPYTTNFFLYGL